MSLNKVQEGLVFCHHLLRHLTSVRWLQYFPESASVTHSAFELVRKNGQFN